VSIRAILEKGRIFGALEVMHQGPSGRQGRSRYWCKCECGSEILCYMSSLKDGKRTSCGCKRAKEGTAFRRCLQTYIDKAADEKREWNLTEDQFRELTQSTCYYTGRLPSNIYKTSCETYIYNGIDRVDNSKGYTPENCVPCCAAVNRAKRDMSIVEFFTLIEEIYRHSIVDPQIKEKEDGI
jgi:hypothetical protein